MLKPFKLFIYLFSLLAILSILSLLFAPDGIRTGNITLRYPSVAQLFDLDTAIRPSEFILDPELAMLEKFLDSISANSQKSTLLIWTDNEHSDSLESISLSSSDTTQISEPDLVIESPVTAEILKNRLVPIEMPNSSFEALKPFFEALANGHVSRQQVRIMHYGDSQIEGDRITSFLRSRLQARFGGSGVGLLHAVPHSYQPGAVSQTISGNWRQVLISDLGRGAVEHRFGILGGYSVFTQPRRMVKGGFNEAWIRFERRGPAHSNPRNFSQCRLFFGYGSEPFMVRLEYKGATQDAEMIGPEEQINQLIWKVPLSERIIKLDIKGDESPLIYGISLESATGIVVDNIPIRGSSGTDFTRADDKSLRRALHLTNPKLIILQFGVNVVPHIVDSYNYYENQMYQQIVAIKRAKPDVAVILIGVSDMSRREGGRYISYPNIEKIRDAQRNAAHRGGAAFWDCYLAMGGRNSMPAWAFANPALASKDFVHFTLRGSNLIAEMFYSSLMETYNNYKLHTVNEK